MSSNTETAAPGTMILTLPRPHVGVVGAKFLSEKIAGIPTVQRIVQNEGFAALGSPQTKDENVMKHLGEASNVGRETGIPIYIHL